MTKDYYLIGEVKEKVYELQGKKMEGNPSSFKSFGTNLTYKKGYHCILAASPQSGKSFWVLNEVVRLAERDGSKTLIFSPEMGDIGEIVALLVTMKSGKTVYQDSNRQVIEMEELNKVLKWLNNHFIIIDSDKPMTMEGLYKIYEKVKEEYKIHIDYLIVDNLNDLVEPINSHGRQDIGIEEMLSTVRRNNKRLGCYTFMVTHSSHQGPPITQGGIKYYPPITPEEVRGGRALYRKAYLFLTIWRPPFGLADEEGIPFEKNEAHIIVLKGKPDGTATKGFVGKVFFNWSKATFTDAPPYINVHGK